MIKQKPTSLKHIKVYEGLYRESNKLGILNDVLFFLEVKYLSKSGIIKDPYNFLMENTNYSKSSIYNKLSRLENLKLIKKGKNKRKEKYIQLVSYPKLFKKLGLDIYKKNKKGNISLPIYKVYWLEFEKNKLSLKDKILKEDIRRNLSKQLNKVYEKHLDKKLTSDKGGAIQKGSNLYNKLKRKLKKDLDLNLEFKKQLHACKDNLLFHANINYDVTLSCKGVSNLFGYKSGSVGFDIEYDLKNKGLLDIINKRKVMLNNDKLDKSSINFLKQNLYNYFKDNGIYISNRNNIYKNISNKILISNLS